MQRLPNRGVFNIELIEESYGFIAFIANGNGAKELFENECGGHRWQGLSGGRVHTSTITVAALDLDAQDDYKIRDTDIEFEAVRGRGHGGQAVNKISSCIIAMHAPTGISVRIDGRSQYHNKIIASQILRARIIESENIKNNNSKNQERKNQIGSGMRGDKVRTYREQDNIVIDHVAGVKLSLDKWRKGNW